MKPVQKYEADDGRLFDSADECAFYEQHPDLYALAGLTLDQLRAVAKDGGDIGMSIERAGRRLGRERIEREGPMRQRAGSADAHDNQNTADAA